MAKLKVNEERVLVQKEYIGRKLGYQDIGYYPDKKGYANILYCRACGALIKWPKINAVAHCSLTKRMSATPAQGRVLVAVFKPHQSNKELLERATRIWALDAPKNRQGPKPRTTLRRKQAAKSRARAYSFKSI